MKKRILSLIMAVCMVLLAVPMFLVPSIAEEATEGPQTDGTFITSFGPMTENWPTADAESDFGFSFKGNWSMGAFDGMVFSEFRSKTVAGSEELLSATSGSQWSGGGLYMVGHSNAWTLGGVDSATYACYTAPYEGTVDLALESLTIGDTENAAAALDHRIAVFVNSIMVWPKANGISYDDWYILKGADLADALDIFTGAKANSSGDTNDISALQDIDVSRGDEIVFAIGRNSAVAGNTAVVTPLVTFHAGYKRIPTKLIAKYTQSAPTWPGLKVRVGRGIGTTEQLDANWRVGYVDTSAQGFSFVETTQHYKSSIKTEVWGGKIPAASDNGDLGEEYYRQFGGIMFKSGTGFIVGNILFPADQDFVPLTTSCPILNGYEYTVPATGILKAEMANITLADADSAEQGENVANAQATLYIYKNSEKLLETTVTTDADGKVAPVDYTTTTGLSVTRGDKITYLFAPVAGEAVVYAGGIPTASITEIRSFMSAAYNPDNPVDLKVETAELVVGRTFGLKLSVYGTIAVYEDSQVGVYVWPKGVEQTVANAAVYECKATNSFSFDFIYNDLSIKELADQFTIQAFAMVKGETIVAQEKTTKSMAEYVMDEYNATGSQERKDLCVALLNYGAAAQNYFGYNTENMANAGLSADEKALDGDYLYDSIMTATNKPNTMCYSEVSGISVIFGNTLSLKVYVDVDPSEVDAMAQLHIRDSENFAASDTQTSPVDQTGCCIYTTRIGLNELSKPVYMRASAKPGRTRSFGYTIRYSVESYVARIANDYAVDTNEGALVRALMEFGNAVAAVKA